MVVGLETLDILLDEFGIERPVHPYEIRHYATTDAERASQRERAFAELRRQGLIDGRGQILGEVEDLLYLLVRPDVLITHVAVEIGDDDVYLYRAGWQRNVGLVTRQERSVVVFDEVRAAQVVDEVVSVLPNVAPVSGAPVTVVQPASNAASTADEFSWPGAARVGGGLPRWFEAPLRRYGLISCSVREPATRLRPARMVERGSVTWFDTAEGRFFSTAQPLGDGSIRHTFTAGDRRRIAARLRRAVDAEPVG